MSDICNDVLGTFRVYVVTKQNGHCSVGTLYREVLGEMVFPVIAFINSKKDNGEAYSM